LSGCAVHRVLARGGSLRQDDRVTFEAAELAVVLSYYDLGVIESITDYVRGSRRSAKVGIVCHRGKFLLKRRPIRRAHPDRVRFAHRVQKHIIPQGVPVARLIETRDDGDTLVHIRENLYELFEFVAGQPYEQTPAEARGAGVVLAQFHLATEGFVNPSTLPTPRGDYHDAPGVRTGLSRIAAALSGHDSVSGNAGELDAMVQYLLGVYDRGAAGANAVGLPAWPECIVHSDWHPGNLLFRKQQVVAVIDYDSARMSRRMIDVANGALQFSIIAGGDPAGWPDELHEERFHAFLEGYESRCPLGDEELRSIPYLMAEALIAECVPPITETGSVGRWAGFRVLQMVRRKVRWMESHGERLVDDASVRLKA